MNIDQENRDDPSRAEVSLFQNQLERCRLGMHLRDGVFIPVGAL